MIEMIRAEGEDIVIRRSITQYPMWDSNNPWARPVVSIDNCESYLKSPSISFTAVCVREIPMLVRHTTLSKNPDWYSVQSNELLIVR